LGARKLIISIGYVLPIPREVVALAGRRTFGLALEKKRIKLDSINPVRQ